MGLQRLPFKDFAGGYNAALSPYDLDTNESQDALNYQILTGNALDKRKGSVQFDSSGYPASKTAENMKGWNRGSNKNLALSIDGTIYLSTTGGALTSKFAGTAGKVWCFQPGQDSTQADFLWCMDGTDTPKKISDAGTVSDWGGTPPNGTMCVVWRNRMIVAGVSGFKQRIFFSDIGNPESPTSGAYGNNWVDIKMTDDDIDDITSLAVVNDLLIVGKGNSIWVVTDDISFANHRIGQVGCVNNYATAILEDKLYFFSKSGLYSTSGYSDVEYEGANVEQWIYDNLNYSALSAIRLCSTLDRRILVAVPTTTTYNTVLWEYYPTFRNRRSDGRTVSPWMPHDLPCSSLALWSTGAEPELYAGDSVTDRLRKIFEPTALDDVGTAISAHWVMSWQSFISEEPKERIRRLNVELSGTVTAELYRDFDISTPKWSGTITSKNVPVDPLWDGGTWDGGTWDEPLGLATLERARPESRGRYHAIRLENNDLATTSTIYAIEFVIRGGKEH